MKSNMKDILSLMQTKGVVEGSSRFNWKDGFYDPERIEALKAMSQEQKDGSGRKGRGTPGHSGSGRSASAKGKGRRG